MRTSKERVSRLGVLLAATLLSASSLAACTAVSPDTAVKPYNASDGIGSSIDVASNTQLLLRNFLVVMKDDGTSGQLVGSVINPTNKPIEINFTVSDATGAPLATGSATAEASGATKIQPGDTAVEFTSLKAKPGEVLKLKASTSLGNQEFSLPIVPAQGPYASLGS